MFIRLEGSRLLTILKSGLGKVHELFKVLDRESWLLANFSFFNT